ncbi:MAG TPA: NADH-quinone oxidoreductase subunit N [Aquifex aeolicus]|uniref:NADH-quinone oxidoreductase subunit N n=1 Tax=Aquifex aeolicus TaxID=63363 RepID=A0A9D0YNV8_AQUAO|nr:NADH-quinone oxidoreductase subunit N [Aquificales bacterium]HIP98007.1 NADH-quinone oxidoreductase subunit N [Aquifex aeolicus]HIQ26846.1 NADH-quinone oxidoreductase subunit N [Aquifex aeolicus]
MNCIIFSGIITLAFGGLLVPIVGNLFKLSREWILNLFLLVFLIAGGLFLYGFGHGHIIYPNLFTTDTVSLLMTIFVWFTGAVVLITIFNTLKEINNLAEILGVYAISLSGAILTLYANNFVSFLVAMELMTIPSYYLIMARLNTITTEAATKYFFNGALSTGFFLFGILVFYAITGDLQFSAINKAFQAEDSFGILFFVFGFIAILSAIGFKMSFAPYHFYAPDTYTGAPASVAAYLAGITKSAVAIPVIRLFFEALSFQKEDWSILLALLAVVTMTIGNLLALAQQSVARILAYSSIAHAGYILVGFAAAVSGLAITGIVYQAVAYILMKAGAFLMVTLLIYYYGIKTREQLRGFGKINPFMALVFTILLLSLAGVPPTAGFIAKVYLFQAAVDAGMAWLAFIGLLNSAFAVAYYLWIIKEMYLEAPQRLEKPKDTSFLVPTMAIGMLAFLTIVFGIWVTPVVKASLAFTQLFPF